MGVFKDRKLRDALVSLWDLAAPRTCIVCGRDLNLGEDHICLECFMDLPLTYYWDRKRNPMADKFNLRIAEAFPEDGSRRYSCAAALLFYDRLSDYKEIPHHVKYGNGIAAGRFFAKMLARKLAGSGEFRDVDYVVPVPLHWTRRLKRGYNQAEVIAVEIGKVLGAGVGPRALRRTRRTRTQTRLDVAAKAGNVAGAFSASRLPDPCPAHILLVDDTFTTGATLCECYRALCAQVPESCKISVAALAYVIA